MAKTEAQESAEGDERRMPTGDTSLPGAGEFGPDFARTPAATDKPLTEQLFGSRGVRVVHYVIYTLAFLLAFAIADLVYATLLTTFWLLAHVFDFAFGGVEADPVQMFLTYVFDPGVVGASLFTAIVLAGIVYYLNETRFRRGEWLRTFL